MLDTSLAVLELNQGLNFILNQLYLALVLFLLSKYLLLVLLLNQLKQMQPSTLAVLPDLRVCLSTALDLLDQGPKGLQGAWIDEW